jgi:hypothetical protein
MSSMMTTKKVGYSILKNSTEEVFIFLKQLEMLGQIGMILSFRFKHSYTPETQMKKVDPNRNKEN